MQGKSRLFVCLSLFLFCFSAFASGARAAYGPKAYLTEYVSQDYWWNGTAKSADIRRGQCEVSVPNNWDVLQYVRVNTTKTNTYIENMFYANTLTSYPTSDSKSALYANVTGNSQANYYNISNVSASPTINLSLSYVNYFGGTDIYDSDNVGTGGSTNTLRFNFTIRNPSGDVALNGVSVTLQFSVNMNGDRDAVNISAGTNSTTADGGSTTTATYMSNSDGVDSDYDRYTWTGNLGPSGIVYIIFNATLLEGAGGNMPGPWDEINLDLNSSNKGGLGNYSSNSLLSGIAINYKLARSSIRQGTDLQISNGVWYARGFIRNMANDSLGGGGEMLTYNVTEWRIYEVNPSTGAPYSLPNISGRFNASLPTSSEITPASGIIYTTENSRSSNTSWYNTTSGTKPYIALYFDWYVLWNATSSDNYASYINTTMDMQTLYKVDMQNTKGISGVIYPDTGGQILTIRDNSSYSGSSSISAGMITMYSIIPANTTAGDYHGMFTINASSIKVYFVNTSNQSELAGNANVNWTVTNVTPNGANGSIKVTILDLSSANIVGGGTVGKNLSSSVNNEKIMLVYDLITNATMTTGDIYRFTGNTTFTTTSGTGDTEYHQTQEVPVSAKRLIGYKDLLIPNPATPTLVNATLVVTVEANATESITGIKFMDYVLNGTFGNSITLYISNLTVDFYDGSWNAWTNGTHYNVTDKETQQLTDGTYVRVYEFINATGTGIFTLSNNQSIRVRYQMDIGTSGSYILPLQIAAFDPSTGESFTAESWGVITVDVPEPALPLQITDHSLELAKRVVVGTPAAWIKNFEVYNPNSRMISSGFQTDVFGDSMQGFVSYYSDRGEKVEESITFGNVQDGKKTMSWSSTLNPFETRTYEVRILTPPVMEIDRDVEVLDKLENKMVKLKMDVFLKSFAEEKYANLVLNLPLSYENILEVKDGFGKAMQFTGGKDTSSIIVDEIAPNDIKTISILYKASYPTIIITPDRDRYDLSAPVNLEILVINGGESIEYPYLEVEIYTPGMDVIYSNMEKLKNMEPLEKTQNYEKFVIPANAPGGMYVASAKFREDFTVLASGTGNFFVVGAGVSTPAALQIIAVLSVTLVLVYFSLKRFRETRRTKGLLEGKGPL